MPRPTSAAKGLFILAMAALGSCAPCAEPAHPAFWRVEGKGGQIAYLFGTIHVLERPAEWRSPPIDQALADAGALVLEIGYPGTEADAGAFERLSHTPDQPPLSARVRPGLGVKLAALLRKSGLGEERFADVETWAAALLLARAADKGTGEYGIDRAVAAASNGKRQVELEGVAGQLGLFDALPEKEQRDLLELVVEDGGDPAGESEAMAATWRRGDVEAIEAETRTGLLADPELRAALFTARNRAWTEKIGAMIDRGERPFVAVGAAHMAGPEGLPAMLAAKGYVVRRIQ